MLGSDGVSHEEVEQNFTEELLLFSSGEELDFYHGKLQHNVRVHLELFVSLQDQPERWSTNYIMLGSSFSTARWGLALDFVTVASGILACSNCLSLLLSKPPHTPSHQCRHCVNWDTDVESELLDFDPPEHYPNEHVLASGKLPQESLYTML